MFILIRIKIKEMLVKRNKTKYWLIKNTECSYQSISKLMNNETSGIQFDTINRLCKVLKCKVSDIIEYEDDEK